jgi:enamine deaminase RidA (YjgF/YER057c/UK114 family)
VDGPVTSPHEIVNPDSLAPPKGFSHAVVAGAGRTVWLGGQTAHDSSGTLQGDNVVEQFDAAASNVVVALTAAGARVEHLVSVQIFVTDADEYRSSLSELGRIYRKHFGSHYPATSLFEIKGLFDPAAKVELVCTAVVSSDES